MYDARLIADVRRRRRCLCVISFNVRGTVCVPGAGVIDGVAWSAVHSRCRGNGAADARGNHFLSHWDMRACGI